LRILVTGAGGFVGSHVVRRLQGRAEVAVLVRSTSSMPWRLAGLAEPESILQADLGDRLAVRAALHSWPPEACVHLAWYAEPGLYLEAPENLDCLRMSLDLVEELAAAGCRRLVAAGTCAEYDLSRVERPLTEGDALGPTTLYAASKLASSLVAANRCRQLGLSFAWARLFYLYGPKEDERRLVPAVIASLLAGHEFKATAGDQVRDYLQVEDVAEGLALLALGDQQGDFNVASGEAVTVRHLLQTVAEILGRPELLRLGELPYRSWEPPYVCGDSGRLRDATGWKPVEGLRDGLETTVGWWRNQASNPPVDRVSGKDSREYRG
jgi:nucleoside-diphosphate-sugar epimerase